MSFLYDGEWRTEWRMILIWTFIFGLMGGVV